MLQAPQRRALDVLAVIVIGLMLCIAVQVAANTLGVATLVRFDRALPLLGEALTINGLMELQWHLLALTGFLPMALVWTMDRHVRVDFLYAAAPLRTRRLIELAGHLLFTLPFLWFSTRAGWTFAAKALEVAERSRDGGLADRYLIKGMVPAALAVLFVVVAVDGLRQARALAGGR